ncbi:hypothetical protein D3C81_1421940 [compost metagenome]
MCAQIASAAPQVGSSIIQSANAEKAEKRADLEWKNKLRKSMKSVTAVLGEMHQSLVETYALLCEEASFPPEVLRDNPYEEIIAGLRMLEATMSDDIPLASLPILGDEYRGVRRKLAHARSVATRIQILINQKLNTPEVFEGQADAEGLRALANMSTERLHHLVG